MPKFRARPRFVEAEQWIPGKAIEGVELITFSGTSEYEPPVSRWFLITSLGRYEVFPGYWIVTNDRGDRIAMDPVIFSRGYEPVEE